MLDRVQASLWHAMPAGEVLRNLDASERGLTGAEADRRLAALGANRLPEPPRKSALMRLLLQFHNVLIYVLIVAALVTAGLGHWIDTAVILGVVVINALIGFVQEGRAERAMEAVRDILSPDATVLRDGSRVTIPVEHVVPGDIVLLGSGDKVPADLRLISLKNLQVQEALLTGESLPVAKSLERVDPNAPLGDRLTMAYSGTIVTYGQATGVVVATGAKTEIGRVSRTLGRIEELTTPLLRRLAVFGRWLSAAILAVAVATFAFGIFVRGEPVDAMFMAAVGIAVAAIPEGLPAIITIALAIGVRIMAEHNAIVRRLPAVETLGSATVICSDKTGTLTRNELAVRTVSLPTHDVNVEGVGYVPIGEFMSDGQRIDPTSFPDLLAALRFALLCSDASLFEDAGTWKIAGDPTEGALLVAARKAGLDHALESSSWPRLDSIPFESEHRYMGTLHQGESGRVVVVKGAPERILELCDSERADGRSRPLDTERWCQRMNLLAGAGQRLLAVAVKPAAEGHATLDHHHVREGFELLAMFGFIDPPRPEAVSAIAECHQAGIAVKMITGDHARTAEAIGKELGLDVAAGVVTGVDLDRMRDEELREAARAVHVFARTSPEHKLRLVEVLQADGHVVAMTGDGVNDAPALKRADIGIAMGRKGTEAAKEASEMVLADDNFATIAAAVRRGRIVYDNLQKTILFTLPTNGGEALTLIMAILLGFQLPMTPLQILWVNMVTSVTLGVALAFERGEKDVMLRPPRPRQEPIVTGLGLWRIVLVSMLMVTAALGIFVVDRLGGAPLDEARTKAVNTLVMVEIFYLFSARHLRATSLSLEGLSGSPPVLITVGLVLMFQVVFTHVPFMQALFGTVGLDLTSWLQIFGIGAAVFLILEGEKAALRALDKASDVRKAATQPG